MGEPGRPGVLIDRDGVLNEDLGYVGEPARLKVVPGAGQALAGLKAHGLATAVVSSQSGVARGYYTEEDVRITNEALSRLLAAEGAAPDAYYYCPHHPEGAVAAYAIACDCRKPAPGLIERAIEELGLDRTRVVMVGNEARDIECGRAACVATVAVGPDAASLGADHAAASLADAVDWIAERTTGPDRDSGAAT
jgi:D-glycero-D-manno-heptose 1,7-bisphosphate phosphatase